MRNYSHLPDEYPEVYRALAAKRSAARLLGNTDGKGHGLLVLTRMAAGVSATPSGVGAPPGRLNLNPSHHRGFRELESGGYEELVKTLVNPRFSEDEVMRAIRAEVSNPRSFFMKASDALSPLLEAGGLAAGAISAAAGVYAGVGGLLLDELATGRLYKLGGFPPEPWEVTANALYREVMERRRNDEFLRELENDPRIQLIVADPEPDPDKLVSEQGPEARRLIDALPEKRPEGDEDKQRLSEDIDQTTRTAVEGVERRVRTAPGLFRIRVKSSNLSTTPRLGRTTPRAASPSGAADQRNYSRRHKLR